MSGVASGLKKAFSGVFKAVKKIALPVLAIGAAVFTGGAALGLPALAGGWGGAVTTGLSKLGFSSTGLFGKVLTGAVTKAGTSALLGGVAGAVSGQGFAKGAQMGALGGALLGGLSGAFTPSAVGAAGATTPAASGVATAQTATRGILGGGGATSLAGSAAGDTLASAATTAAPAAATGGNVLRGLLNPETLGGVLSNAASGYMQGRAIDEQERQRQAERQRVTDSYDIDPVSMRWWERPEPEMETSPETPGVMEEAPGPDMSARRFTPRPAGQPKRFRFNPETRSIDYG